MSNIDKNIVRAGFGHFVDNTAGHDIPGRQFFFRRIIRHEPVAVNIA